MNNKGQQESNIDVRATLDYFFRERDHLRSMALVLIVLSSGIYGYHETKYQYWSDKKLEMLQIEQEIYNIEKQDINNSLQESIKHAKNTNNYLKEFYDSKQSERNKAMATDAAGMVLQVLAIFLLIFLGINVNSRKKVRETNFIIIVIKALLLVGFAISAFSLVIGGFL